MTEGFQNFNTQNFNPLTMANMTQSVILICLIIDVSPSISSYADAMNTAAREVFLDELRKCHRKDDIMIKCITFASEVKEKSGFAPITSIPDDYLDVVPEGRSTSLYEAVAKGLKSLIDYRTELEEQGVDVRSLAYIITDGEDNEDIGTYKKQVNGYVDQLRSNEAWASSFNINMLGVGRDTEFRGACQAMGLNPDKCLDKISNSAKEIRKHMGIISQSVSSSSNQGTGVSF